MAIIDLVRWAPQGGETIYAWRFPETNLSTYTQLIVQESQEALLFSKGQLVGKFGPGKHTLDTENLPVLRSLFGIPFGGKNPFTAEVWFINRIQAFNIGWSTDRMSIHDADYNVYIPLAASGRYGLNIVDAEKFLIKVVGTKARFSESDFTDQFEGEFTTKVKSTISQYMGQNRIGFKQLSAYLVQMSDYLKEYLGPFCADLGLELTKFYVSTIDIDDSAPDGQRIKDAIAKQGEMSITGHTWQQEQLFGTANNAIGGMAGASGGGLLGGLMALNMMGGMGGGAANAMMQPQYQQPSFGGAPQPQDGRNSGGAPQPQAVKMVYCSNCAHKFPNSMRFCPKCGDPYNPCPKCGTDNDKNARRCVSCGMSLQSETSACPQCNAPLAPGSAFCGNCGARIASGDTCARCGSPMPGSVKFCPMCGNKR